MKAMLCIRDQFGDTHAIERNGGNTRARAVEFAEMLGIETDETFSYGVTWCDDVGLARLRQWQNGGDVRKVICCEERMTMPVTSVSIETESQA